MIDLSYSRISTWKQCRKAFAWQYDRKLSSKLVRPELSLGKSIHETFATFYKIDPLFRTHNMLSEAYEASMYKVLEELEAFKGGLEQKDKDTFTKTLEKGNLWLKAYWNKYGIDESIPKSETEKFIEVNLDDIHFVAYLDGLVNDDGSDWVLEHKTGNPEIEQLLLEDEQSLYYIFALRKLDYNPKGVIYNIVSNPTRTSDGLVREATERTDLEIKYLGDEIRQVAKEIQTLPRYPNRGKLCSWCGFKQLCYAEWFGGDVEYLIQKNYTQG